MTKFFPRSAKSGDQTLNQSDPTDSALAAIASILDQPEARREPHKTAADEKPAAAQPTEAAGYSKVGPGPIAAIRFRWTVREDGGDYYVDETIGARSALVLSGPMTGNAAIEFVDDREAEARQRFENLKNEMTGGGGS